MRWWIGILILASLSLSSLITYSQTPEYKCTDLTNTLDLTTYCEKFMTCEDGIAVCMQEGVAFILSGCNRAGLSNCETRSVLYWVVDHHVRMDESYLWHPEGFESSLLATVSAFDNQDFESALLEFDDIVQSEEFTSFFTLRVAHGALYFADGNYDEAFKHFDNSINGVDGNRDFARIVSEFNNPIAYYFRGLIYRQQGDEDHALQDFYTYDALASEQLKIQLPLSPFRFTMNNPQAWTMYPVVERFAHGYTDLTLAESSDVLISYHNDGDTLIVAGLVERRFEDTPEILFLERDPDNPSGYYFNLNVPDIVVKPDTYHLKITVYPMYLEYYETIWHMEGISTKAGIMLPTEERDIRGTSPLRMCDGSNLSFLNIGDTLTITSPYGEVSLVDDPLLEDEFVTLRYEDFEETTSPYTVIEDPVCFDGGVWWRISNGIYTGWLTESDAWRENFFWGELSSRYLIMPRHLVETWEASGTGLFGIPTPLEFLGLTLTEG